MTPLLGRAARRFYLRHPWQLALAIAGISLGVAVYVGVDLANDSARRAFELSEAAVTGRTTHRLLAVGGGLDETVYRDLVLEHRAELAAPVIEADIALAGSPRTRYPLLGIDPLEEIGLRSFSGFIAGNRAEMARLIAEPGTVLVPEALASSTGVQVGSALDLDVGGRLATVEVVGLVRAAPADVTVEPPIVADIATAQELLGRPGVISRVDLRLDAAAARELSQHLPAGTTLVDAAEQDRGFAELASAFRTNLAALGLLALVVGMFLIYGTMAFAIVQRRQTLGVFRALGLRRRELLMGVLAEAAALGGVATLIGLLLGHLLARGLVDIVLRTIGDLYFSAAVSSAPPSPWIYLKGAVLGVGATLIAAAKPALDAARATPAAAVQRAPLERAARRAATRSAWLSVPVLTLGGVLLAASERSLYAAFGGLFFVLAAGALVTPAFTMILMKACERPAERLFGLPGVLSVRGVSASLSRTGVATAALAVAVATVIGVGLMIASFRTSLVEWLDTTLTANLYVSFAADGARLDAATIEAVERLPGVAGVSLSRTVRVPAASGAVIVRAAQPGPAGWGIDLVDGDPERALAALARGDAVVIAEPMAFALGLQAGDELPLPTAAGERRFPIVGVYRDYNTSGRSLLMALDTYRRHWDDERLGGIGVHTERGVSDDAVERALRATLLVDGGFRVRSTAGIERLSLEVFDRTFQITEVLRVLAGLIAFLGILSALLSIELERSRELAVLRAIGFAPRDLRTALLTQTALLGAAAGAAAVPIGAALAGLLVHVINRRSFGWSMDFVVTPGPLVTGLTLALTAALLAGVYPAWRAGRMELAAALREE